MTEQVQGLIRSNEPVGGYWRLVLAAPTLAAVAKPGQFVQVRCSEGADPLLRRPLSFAGIDPERGEISLLYAVVGRGTQWLSGRKSGETLDLLGPIGNGFALPQPGAKAILVGGGIGIAPLLPLAAALLRQGNVITALAGARSADCLPAASDWPSEGIQLVEATDDGSRGCPGLVTALLPAALAAGPDAVVYACGPRPMLREVARQAVAAGVPGQLSLEERMGCGVGACLSCVCKVKIGSAGSYTYQRVCTEGPVFRAEEVLFDD